MSSKARNRQMQSPLPKREIVEVFKTMQLEQAAQREHFIRMGDYGRTHTQPTYYSIEVTGTVDSFDCR